MFNILHLSPLFFFFFRAPLRKDSISSTPYTSDASTEPTPQKPKSARQSATPAKRPPPGRVNQERILTSRSANDVTGLNTPSSQYGGKNNKTSSAVTIKTPDKMLSPVGSFDHELGELERQLTDTRKSIDAKFYKSLANSSSPFFRPSAKANATRLSSPSDYSTFSEENDFPLAPQVPPHGNADGPSALRKTSKAIADEGAVKSFHTEVTFEPLKFTGSPPHSSTSPASGRKLRSRNESMEQAMKNPRRSVVEESTAFITPTSPTKNRNFNRNADPITFEIHAKGGQVTQVKSTATTGASSGVASSIEDNKKSAGDSGSFSDSGILLDKVMSVSRETLLSDNDASGPNRKGSLVKTKVREASDIIHERSYGRDSPVQRDVISRKTHSVDHTNSSEHAKLVQRFSHQPPLVTPSSSSSTTISGSGKPLISTSIKEDSSSTTVTKPTPTKSYGKSPRSPKLNVRDTALVKALGSAARSKQDGASGGPTSHKVDSSKMILDDSLTDTFAKLESAFTMKPGTPDSSSVRDERRKKRRNYAKRRSRNFEPSSTDSSDDDDSSVDSRRRSSGLRIQLKSRNDDPDTCSITSNKSEAEQSLEAAISDFHNSLSTMPQKNNKCQSLHSSDQNEDAPKVPSRPRPSHSRYNNTRENRSKSIDFTATSRPLTGLESKSVGNVEQVKRRSEAKITLTSARPWSPPLKRVEPSANIRHNVSKGKPKALVLVKNNEKKVVKQQTSEEVFEVEEQIITETSVEDQLSPLPGGPPPRNLSGYRNKDSTVASRYTNSLPGRSKRRRASYKSEKHQQQPLRSKSSKSFFFKYLYFFGNWRGIFRAVPVRNPRQSASFLR